MLRAIIRNLILGLLVCASTYVGAQQPSTVALTPSSTNVTANQSVEFQVSVGPTTNSTPTGTVTFMNGAATLGTATLNSGFTAFAASYLPVGNNSITAVYSGDSNFTGSTSARVQITVTGTPVARINLSPPVALTVVGDITGALPASPPNYTGPVSGLVLNGPQSAITDANGNLYILDQGGTVVWVVASGNGPIPTLPSVKNPQANYAYPLAGQGNSGCTTDSDGVGDGCLASEAMFECAEAGIALDSYGNLYIADNNYNNYPALRVVYAGGTVPGLSNLTPGFIYQVQPVSNLIDNPYAVALDSFGNVYIGESAQGLQVLYSGGQIPNLPANPVPGNLYTIDGGGYRQPYFDSIFADSLGNIYVGDDDNSDAEVFYAAGTIPGVSNPTAGQVYLLTERFSSPTGPENGIPATSAAVGTVFQPALDTFGNLYLPDNSDGYVFQVTPAGILNTIFGTPTPGCQTAIDVFGDGCYGSQASLSGPYSVAFDASNDMFIANNGTNLVRELSAQTSALSFGSQTVGTTSPVQSVTVTNTGTAPLTFSAITISSQFAQASSGGTDCSTSKSIAPGASCEIGIVYAPTQSGLPAGTVTIASNAGGTSSTNTVSLTGTTLFVSSTAVTLAATTAGEPCCYLSEFLTLTATVSSAGGGTPTGTITFTNSSGVSLGTVTLSNGTASVSTNALPYGANGITATYSGDPNHDVSTGQLTFGIGPGVTMVLNPTTVTVQAGGSQTASLTVTPVGFEEQTVALTCLPSAPGLTCSFSASELNFNTDNSGTPPPATVTITLNAASVASLHRPSVSDRANPLSLALAVPGILALLGLTQRRRLRIGKTMQGLILAFAVLAGAMSLTSCSSGSNSTSPPQPVTQTVTINAIDTTGHFISTTTFQVTVQ